MSGAVGAYAPSSPTRVWPVVSAQERDPAPELPQGELVAEPVPVVDKAPKVPLVRQLMPIIMVAAMVAMVIAMVIERGRISPMMLIFPMVMAMSMLMMFLPAPGTDLDATRRSYLRHLAALQDAGETNARAQLCNATFQHPAPAQLRALVGTNRMWERGASCSDALQVRVGVGRAALITPVRVADPGAAEDLDPVCAVSLRATVRGLSHVPDMPLVVALGAFPYLGLSGPAAEGLARYLVAQLAVQHGPEVVGIAVRGPGWDWLKWLPHTREVDRAAYRILLVAEAEAERDYSAEGQWTTIIDVGTHPGTLLGEAALAEGMVLHADEEIAVLTENGSETLGRVDSLPLLGARQIARALTAYCRPAQQAGGGTRGSELLDLLGMDAPAVAWAPRGAARLRVPFGVTATGEPCVLDVKESAQGGMGPHGLCIGATGSGKSEFLRSLVVALAATHTPEDLNLVLVDFKGGATFLGLDELPHTSAVITNLSQEEILVDRMHDAISGEMNRRQELLRSAGNYANLTEYRAAREERPELEPFPSLLIIVDEFSELLGQHPDFAELFVAVGRLGRSLGVHLLLASQRLEEGKLRGLDSHLSYRIGLKTFSAAESRQVLGVPDAYHLPALPGSGYLKAEADQLVAFRAAYVSGPLRVRRPLDLTDAASARPRIVPFSGWDDVEHAETEVIEDASTTPLRALVHAAREAAAALQLPAARQIWLPPLPAELELADVAQHTQGLQCAVGIIDRPYQQRQDPAIVDFATSGGHLALCGGPQSGTTTALRTIVAALALANPTSRLRFYVLDFGGGLSHLARLPHVAGVVNGRTDSERVHRLIDEVCGIIDAPDERDTFLVLDGWGRVSQDYEDEVERLTRIASEGPSARVHLVLSTQRWTAVRPAVRDLIGHRLELKLTEAMDSLIDRRAQEKVPALPGRGLTEDGEQMLIAHGSVEDVEHVRRMTSTLDSVPALKVLPTRLSADELPAGLYFAVGGPALEPVEWDRTEASHILIIGGQGAGKSTALRTLAARIVRLGRERARLVVIDPRRSHMGAIPAEMLAGYAATTDAARALLADVVTTATARLPAADITAEELAARSWWSGPDLFLCVDDLDLLPEADLAQLAPLLPHARDIGLHLVLARKAGGVGRALYGGFLAAVKDQNPGVLLLDADRDEGVICGMKPQRRAPGRGMWQIRGSAVGLVHVATTHRSPSEIAAKEGHDA